MPRRSTRTKAEPDANVETRVTRRSLRGAQPESAAKATPAKESPAKPAARGRGSRSTSRRGRSEAEEEVEEEPTVEPTAESEASEEPEEVVPASPRKGKKSPAPARGRGRGRSRGRSPRAAAAKADKEDEAEEDEAAEAAVKDTVSPSRRSRRPSAKTTPKTTPTRSSRRGRSSVPEAEPEAPMEEEAAADDKEDKKRKREDEEEESKPEDEEKAVKKQKIDEAPVEDKPADASKEEGDTKETEEAMETEAVEEVKEDVKMAESKEPTAEAAKKEAQEAAKEEEAPEKEESKIEEEPKKAADEDEPMVEEEAANDEAKSETKEDEAETETKEEEAETETKADEAETETKEDEAKTETKEDEAKTETMAQEAAPDTETKEDEPVPKEPEVATEEPEVATKEPEAAIEEPEAATKEPEVTTKEPEVAIKEPEAERQEPTTNDETAEAAPVEEEMKVDEPETTAEQEAETPSADSSETKPTEEQMEAAAYAAPDKAESSDSKDVIKDYVVINMEDVPASDSAEVSQCVPAEKPATTEESTPNQREENAATTDQTAEKMSTEVASNGSSTHLSNSTPADTQHHNDTAVNGSDTDSSADPLFSRKFIANPNLAADVDQSKKFTLVSYNILADCHTRPEKYPWIDKGSLPMEARSKRFIQELEYLDADIICLQEVSPDYYNDTLVPTLKASGYEGVFKKRIDDYYNEGEATFFRSSQFSLVSHRGLSLRDVAFKELEACGLDTDKAAAVKAFIDRPAVVLITQLKSNSSGTLLTVGNIHISYEPITNLDLQCIQAACAVKEVVSMSESPNSAHVICGDFNARPETVVYQLTKEGYLNDTSMTALQAMQNVTMKDDTKQALVNLWWKGFQHTSSSLRSCYSTVTGSEPMSALSHTGACRNIDYIWCGGSNLDVAGVAAASPADLIVPGIPNATFPSDHLSLKAELFFK